MTLPTKTAYGVLLFITIVTSMTAQGVQDAAFGIVPDGVQLGMSVVELRKVRTAIFPGPAASGPVDSSKQKADVFPIFMEVDGIGKPGHLGYWYFTSADRVIGVMKTKALIGIDAQSSYNEAQALFTTLVQVLGASRQETFLRQGTNAFVPVRADIWEQVNPKRTVYYIATSDELSTAIVQSSDFPLGEVFIKPNPEIFVLEGASERRIRDIERPRIGQDARARAGEVQSSPKATGTEAAGGRSALNQKATMPGQPTGSKGQRVTRSRMIVIAVIGVAAGIAFLFILVRRSKGRTEKGRV